MTKQEFFSQYDATVAFHAPVCNSYDSNCTLGNELEHLIEVYRNDGKDVEDLDDEV